MTRYECFSWLGRRTWFYLSAGLRDPWMRRFCRPKFFICTPKKATRRLSELSRGLEYSLNLYWIPNNNDFTQGRECFRMTPRRLSWLVSAFLFKAFPLDMSQYPSLFNTTRIPRKGKDEIFRDPSVRHFVVMRKGHFFTVDLFNKDGEGLEWQNVVPDIYLRGTTNRNKKK